jgi:catalase
MLVWVPGSGMIHFPMQGVPDSIIERQLRLFQRVHPDYAHDVRAALGLVVR